MAAVRGRQPAWRQGRQLGDSAVLAAVAARWQRRHHQLGSGSAAAAVASLAAEIAAWQMRSFGGSGSVLGSAAAARRHWQKRGVGSISVALGETAAAAAAAGRAARWRRGRGGMC